MTEHRRGRIVSTDGAMIFERGAVDLLQIMHVIAGLRLEANGIKIRRGVSCLKIAKAMTGNKSNDRELQISLLQVIQADKEQYIERVIETEGPTKEDIIQ